MNRLILIVFIVIQTSCVLHEDEKKVYKRLIDNYPNYDAEYFAYVVIPPVSCITCGNYAVDICKELIKDEYPVKVIFECHPSDYKYFRWKIEELSVNENSFIVDTLLMFSTKVDSLYSDVPVIVYLENNNIVNIEYHNSKNVDSFEKLRKRCDSE